VTAPGRVQTWRDLAFIATSRMPAKGRTWSSLLFFEREKGFASGGRLFSPHPRPISARSGVILSEPSAPKPREPIFNIPAPITITIAVLVLVQLARIFLLTDEQDADFILAFGFIPARYSGGVAIGSLPGGFAADLWTFFTYAFIHADWTHLGFNLAWLVPFGSALARRFGAWRYPLFMLVTAAFGALAHLATHLGAIEPMIGASAAISGAMAAAMRFIFQRDRRLAFFRDGADAAHLPALPLAATLRDPRFLLFLVTWVGLNALFGFGTITFGAEAGQEIAWQAHVGGFFAGLVLFKAFDPAPSPPELTAEPSA
jgi:membrane associated rhomboid family serine protease